MTLTKYSQVIKISKNQFDNNRACDKTWNIYLATNFKDILFPVTNRNPRPSIFMCILSENISCFFSKVIKVLREMNSEASWSYYYFLTFVTTTYFQHAKLKHWIRQASDFLTMVFYNNRSDQKLQKEAFVILMLSVFFFFF